MRCNKCHVGKKRLVRILFGMLLQTLNRVVRGAGRGIVTRFVGRWLDRNVVFSIAFGRKKVALIVTAIRSIKTGVEALSVEVPLAAVVTSVAVWFQVVWNEPCPRWPFPSRATASTQARNFISSDHLCVKAGHQCRTRRPTTRRIVKLSESNSARRKPIEVRRVNLASVATKIGIP